jgi:hypothetical protein
LESSPPIYIEGQITPGNEDEGRVTYYTNAAQTEQVEKKFAGTRYHFGGVFTTPSLSFTHY